MMCWNNFVLVDPSALEENESNSWMWEIVWNLTIVLMQNWHGLLTEAFLVVQFHCSINELPFEKSCFGILFWCSCQKQGNIASWWGLGVQFLLLLPHRPVCVQITFLT